MRYSFFVFIMALSINVFSQAYIEGSKSILTKKNQFIKLDKKNDFHKKFYISNTENQPFITANIIIEGIFSEDVDILVRHKDEEWSVWKNIKEDFHFRKDGRISKEMIYLPQGVKEFELKSNFKNHVNSIRVDFFYPEFTEYLSSKEVAYNEKQGLLLVNCNCPMPAFEARLDWCPSGNCPAQTNPSYTTVTHLIVHHAAGPNTSSDWAATVRSIWNYHVNSNGWSDIGYNYLVAPNGVIYEGRGNNVIGAHVGGANTGTMGVCLLGNYDPATGNGTPSNVMISKLEELLSWKECDLSIDPLLSAYHSPSSQTLMNISGHRDAATNGTTCPGDNAYNFLPNIRTGCSNYMLTCSQTAGVADLVVSSVSTNPIAVLLNQNTVIDYVIGNGGTASVIDSIKVDLEIDGVLIETNYLDSLSAGGTASFNLSNHMFSSIGNHNICVYISSASNETNVGNNSYCKTVDVTDLASSSDIVISNFFLNNNQINIDEVADVDFSFKNVGDVSTSEAVSAKVKVDNVLKLTFTIPVLAVNDVFSKNFTYNFSSIGEHDICVEVSSPANETNVSNNSECKSIEVFPISSVDQIDELVNLNVFPNPTKDRLNIVLNLKNKMHVSYELNNILGQALITLKTENALAHKDEIDISYFSSGIYFLNISIGNRSTNKRIVVE